MKRPFKWMKPVDWLLVAVITAAATVLLGGGGGAMVVRTIGKLKTAARIACEYADDVEGSNGVMQVEAAKRKAQAAQEAAGVITLTQKLRGKPRAKARA